MASDVPVLLVGPIAGALVDRKPDKRRLLLRAELISAALILVMIPAAGIVELPFAGDYELPLTVRLIAIFTIVFLASTVAQGFVSVLGSGPFKVGGYSTNTGLPAGATMDEFRLYSHALTDQEVANLYLWTQRCGG